MYAHSSPSDFEVFHQLMLQGAAGTCLLVPQRVALAGAEFTVQVGTLGCSGAIWDLGDILLYLGVSLLAQFLLLVPL